MIEMDAYSKWLAERRCILKLECVEVMRRFVAAHPGDPSFLRELRRCEREAAIAGQRLAEVEFLTYVTATGIEAGEY